MFYVIYFRYRIKDKVHIHPLQNSKAQLNRIGLYLNSRSTSGAPEEALNSCSLDGLLVLIPIITRVQEHATGLWVTINYLARPTINYLRPFYYAIRDIPN